MNNFYLDTNILVCLVTKDDRKEKLIEALKVIEDIEDSAFVTSNFTFVEMAKVLTHTKRQNPKAVAKQINRITKDTKIADFKFGLIPTSPSSAYTFEDFWIDVGENMNLYNPGWGDSIHCVVMKNNKIPNIISLDGKDDFEIVPGITLIDPLSLE